MTYFGIYRRLLDCRISEIDLVGKHLVATFDTTYLR
jgi:hypothetical protein